MSDRTVGPEADLERLAAAFESADPPPAGLVERMRAAARSEVRLADLDLDFELLTLVERTSGMAGARGSSAYTLRFAYDDIDVLVRASGNGTMRLDGWLVPPTPMIVRVLALDGSPVLETAADALGRFEFAEVESGMVRLLLLPEGDGAPLASPAFEI
ncbi:MAG: hypothetical protein WAW88_13870 [Nocardioides sp.]